MDGDKAIDRRTRRTKAAIKKAFFEIAGEKGLAKVTVSEVADCADINRKTFYHHYESIESLIDDILEDEARNAASAIRDGLLNDRGEVDVMQLLEVLSERIVVAARRNGAVLAGVDTEKFVRHFEPILARIASEQLPEVYGDASEEQVRILVTFIFSGLINTFHRWIAVNSEIEMEQLAKILSILVTSGLDGFRRYTAPEANARP